MTAPEPIAAPCSTVVTSICQSASDLSSPVTVAAAGSDR